MNEGKNIIFNSMVEISRKFQKIFGDRFYGELQWNASRDQMAGNQLIIETAKEVGFNLVSTCDSHYPRPEQWQSRILYKKLGWLNKKETDKTIPENVDDTGYHLYPKNGEQMWEDYKKYSHLTNTNFDEEIILKSIEESHNIAFDRIENFKPETTIKLPNFLFPNNLDPDRELNRLTMDAFNKRSFAENKNIYKERLEQELEIIKSNNFSKYFLTTQKIVEAASNKMLGGTARGSGAASLVAYLLGITQLDPIKYDLQFERFMRLNQTSFPDQDLDFSRADELKKYLIEFWGKDNVVPISNFSTLQLKSLIKDISKFYEIPFQETNEVTIKMMEEATPLAKQKHGITAGVYVPTFEECLEFSETLKEYIEKYPQIEKHIKVLQGQIRSLSVHAGGLLISDNISENMPLISNGGNLQTPWAEGQTIRNLEPMGFIKFDVLGLETLDIFEKCITHILKRYKNISEPKIKDIKKYYDENIHPDVLDLNDQKVYEGVFQKGKWAATFQFSQEPAQNFCKQVKPTNIEEITNITSIFRPRSNGSSAFQNNTWKLKTIKNLLNMIIHLSKKFFGKLTGNLIFQEQIASLAHKLGQDISLEEGNELRKVLTKKGTGKEEKVKKEIREKFTKGCLKKGLSLNKTSEWWNKMENFAKYGFNLRSRNSLFHYFISMCLVSYILSRRMVSSIS